MSACARGLISHSTFQRYNLITNGLGCEFSTVETKAFSKALAKGHYRRGRGILKGGGPGPRAQSHGTWWPLLRDGWKIAWRIPGVSTFRCPVSSCSPGWFIEQGSVRGPVWVLEPKMLPAFMEHEPVCVAPTDSIFCKRYYLIDFIILFFTMEKHHVVVVWDEYTTTGIAALHCERRLDIL